MYTDSKIKYNMQSPVYFCILAANIKITKVQLQKN